MVHCQWYLNSSGNNNKNYISEEYLDFGCFIEDKIKFVLGNAQESIFAVTAQIINILNLKQEFYIMIWQFWFQMYSRMA